MDSPLIAKIIIFFLIALAVFTFGLVMERLAIISFKEKASKDFDKEFNSGEMLDVIYNRLSNKEKIHAPTGRIFFIAMKELTQSNIRNIDFAMEYAEDVKRNIRTRMVSMSSVEKSNISFEMKGGITFLIIIAVIGPMLGLLGTLYGIMYDLHYFKITPEQQSTLHIVNALYASISSTIIGIASGIIAIIGYNIIVSKINQITIENELFCVKVANMLSRELDLITANSHARKAISEKQNTGE